LLSKSNFDKIINKICFWEERGLFMSKLLNLIFIAATFVILSLNSNENDALSRSRPAAVRSARPRGAMGGRSISSVPKRKTTVTKTTTETKSTSTTTENDGEAASSEEAAADMGSSNEKMKSMSECIIKMQQCLDKLCIPENDVDGKGRTFCANSELAYTSKAQYLAQDNAASSLSAILAGGSSKKATGVDNFNNALMVCGPMLKNCVPNPATSTDPEILKTHPAVVAYLNKIKADTAAYQSALDAAAVLKQEVIRKEQQEREQMAQNRKWDAEQRKESREFQIQMGQREFQNKMMLGEMQFGQKQTLTKMERDTMMMNQNFQRAMQKDNLRFKQEQANLEHQFKQGQLGLERERILNDKTLGILNMQSDERIAQMQADTQTTIAQMNLEGEKASAAATAQQACVQACGPILEGEPPNKSILDVLGLTEWEQIDANKSMRESYQSCINSCASQASQYMQ
jgi:Ni/Co efflux regulator RcnB